MNKLIGREKEIKELERCVASKRSELVVVYGRRRVGKTFLVRKFFDDNYAFYYVGAHVKSTKQQLNNFSRALQKYSGSDSCPSFSTWTEAFVGLQNYLESRTDLKRKIIFIDEMPWIDNKQSHFVEAFEYFWNSWVAGRDDIVLIACGSATSWMVDKLEENRGGLHGRITCRIYLHPFTLHECQLYLQSQGFDWDEYQLIQNYMIMGGIPYYLSLLDNKKSLRENVDSLFFSRGGMLRNEFDELYNSLFAQADKYIEIAKLLSQHREGLLRTDIEKKTGQSGGSLTRILKNLEQCDFITGFNQLGKKNKGTIYKLVDFYTLFYFKYMADNRSGDEQYWTHHHMSRQVATWEGFSFELVCLMHVNQIKTALGISGIATEVSTWRMPATDNKKGAQVDLIIKRVDKITHLCEMKFCDGIYTITADYEEKLRQRQMLFCEITGIKRGIAHTFITPMGVGQGKHYGIVHSEITAKELFAK